jgi:hypothetical protein
MVRERYTDFYANKHYYRALFQDSFRSLKNKLSGEKCNFYGILNLQIIPSKTEKL